MSAAIKKETVSKDIIVCDICGEEIESAERRRSFGRLQITDEEHPASSKANWLRFFWPVGVNVSEPALPHTSTQYDFHGDCLVRQVEAAKKVRTEQFEGHRIEY